MRIFGCFLLIFLPFFTLLPVFLLFLGIEKYKKNNNKSKKRQKLAEKLAEGVFGGNLAKIEGISFIQNTIAFTIQMQRIFFISLNEEETI